MENNLKKLGETERIVLYIKEENLGEIADGFVVEDKETGEKIETIPSDRKYGKDMMQILSSLPDEDDEEDQASRLFGVKIGE